MNPQLLAHLLRLNPQVFAEDTADAVGRAATDRFNASLAARQPTQAPASLSTQNAPGSGISLNTGFRPVATPGFVGAPAPAYPSLGTSPAEQQLAALNAKILGLTPEELAADVRKTNRMVKVR